MTDHNHSRRRFVEEAGKLAALGLITPAAMRALQAPGGTSVTSSAVQPTWDLSWIMRLADATDRAVFDWWCLH